MEDIYLDSGQCISSAVSQYYGIWKQDVWPKPVIFIPAHAIRYDGMAKDYSFIIWHNDIGQKEFHQKKTYEKEEGILWNMDLI